MYTELMYPHSYDLFRRLNRFLSMPSMSEGDWPFGSLSTGELATNVREDDDAFYVEMEVPGVKPEDIDLSFIGTELTLKINRPASNDNKDVRYLRRERVFGTMVRTITLPMDSAPKEMDAAIENGILCVRLKKPEAAKVQKISVAAK